MTSQHPMLPACPLAARLCDQHNVPETGSGYAAPAAPSGVAFLAMNRRNLIVNTLVSVASLASASAVAAPLTVDDPIFAAIERHKVACLRDMEASDIRSRTVDAKWSPEYDAEKVRMADIAEQATGFAERAAAMALINTRAATMAGVLALLEYVEFFNTRGIKLPSDPGNWSSSPFQWPRMTGEDGVELFGFALLGNIRRSLQILNGAAPCPDVIEGLLKNEGKDDSDVEAKPAVPPEPDLVFKAIVRHDKAKARFDAALINLAEVEKKTDFGTAGSDALQELRRARAREGLTSDRCLKSELALLQTRPETGAGQVAWIRYVRGIIIEDRGGSLERAQLEPFVATIEALLTPAWYLRLEEAQDTKTTI